MATSTFLGWTDDGGFPRAMGFDAVLSETHTFKGEVTKHPVEKGSSISDHVFYDPVTVSLEVQITNTPITDSDLFGNVVGQFGYSQHLDVPSYDPPLSPTPGAVFNAIGNAVKSLFSSKREYSAWILKFSSEQDYVSLAQDMFWKLMKDRTLINVFTKPRAYENMIQVSAPMTREPKLGDAATFHLEFQQLRIVESTSVRVPKEALPKKPVNIGQKSPKEDTNTQSIAVTIKDLVTGK